MLNEANLDMTIEQLKKADGYVVMLSMKEQNAGKFIMDMAPTDATAAFSAFCTGYGHMFRDLNPGCPEIPHIDGLSSTTAERDLGLATVVMETLKGCTHIEAFNLSVGLVMGVCRILNRDHPEIMDTIRQIVHDNSLTPVEPTKVQLH